MSLQNNTVAAISTPLGVGGIGVIRVSGPDAFSVTEAIFAPVSGKKLTDQKGYTAHYGRLHDSDGEFDAKPAGLEIVSSDGMTSEVRVRVSEGKYHQVKRMLASRGAPVVYLKREQIGALKLDPSLEPGQWREMTEEEVQLLEQEANDA